MRLARLVMALLLLASCFSARPLAAQSVYGQVWGRLTAAAGTPVSMAEVAVTSVQTGARARTNTDAGGYFTISNLTPDLYQIEVQADGFKRVESTVSVSVDATTTVDATLQAGDPTMLAAPMSSSGSVLKLDRTDVSTQFDSLNVADLPLLNRNVTELQLLVPGASIGTLFIPAEQNPQGGKPVNINGQHFSGTAFQLDGTENADPLEGIVVINPTLDSVGEMKVTTQGYNAEFGEATAGVVTVQTKSGGNSWHGDGFGFRRTGFGQSENPFDPAGVAPSKYGIFGGSLGGPIAKNKLFLFSDYQGTRSSQGGNLLLSVPPAVVHTTCLGPSGASGSLCNLSDYSQFILSEMNSPLTTTGYLPNSAIPSQSVAILGLIPLPNYTSTQADLNCPDPVICDNFLASGQEVYSADQFDLRTDYNANARMRVFGRYSFGEFYDSGAAAFGQVAGGLGTNPSQYAGVARTRNQGISSGFTYSLGPKLLTDFRFGYFRYRLNVDANDNGQTPAIGVQGIFAADTGDPLATGTPDFEIPGGANGLTSGGTGDYLRLGYSLAADSCACPLREREQQFQFVNNWTRITGKHIIKWGADFRFLQNFRLDSSRPPTGYFDFSPNTTGLGLATFLIGDVTAGFDRTISSPSVVNASEDQKRFNFYGQDTWRINPKFTLNYGLRWEIYFPQTATSAGGFLIPNFANRNPGANLFTGPPAGGVEGSLTNFAPRIGFAYLVNPSTVVRAGYGRSFDAGYAGDLFGIAATDNPPVTVDQNVQGAFNLAQGPPKFQFPTGSDVSLLDLAAANLPNASVTPRIPGSGAVLYAVPSRIRVPTVDAWNLTVQHELTSQLYFELAYVGNKGTNVFTDNTSGGTSYNLDQPTLQNLIQPVVGGNINNCKVGATFGSGSTEYCLSIPQVRSFYQNVQIPNTNCPTMANSAQLCSFNPILFPVNYFGNNSSDNYNSLQVKVRKKFSRGYSMLAHYTWSKGLDFEPNYFASDPRAGYGPDSFDVKHRFVMTNIWDLPIGRNKAWLGGIGPIADRFVGGWTISAITTWRSGIPFSPTYFQTSCNNDTDNINGIPCLVNRVGDVQISGGRKQYFETTGGTHLPGSYCNAAGYCGVNPANGQPAPGLAMGPWQRPGAGQIGNAGRDSLTGPGFFQSDIALAKAIYITEGTSLRFRADAFNAFNRVNLGQPNTCVDCMAGGQITSLAYSATQRLLQFSLTVIF